MPGAVHIIPFRVGITALLAILSMVAITDRADAAKGSAMCSGYSACNKAGYTSHGYNDTTNQKSYWGADPGHNCTNYAAYVEQYTYGIPSPGNDLGNAAQWGTNAPLHGATVNHQPSVGAVAWWNSTAGLGSAGHVAVVESYTSTSVTVSEDAYGGDFDWRTYTTGGNPSYYPTGFIHFKGSNESGGSGRPWAVQYGNEMDVFVRSSGGDLLKIGFNGSSWGTWGDMGGGGSLVSNPFAVQYESEMDVFIRGKDGHIYKDTWNGSKWGGLSSLGGTNSPTMVGDPMAVEYTSGSYHELDVYARGSNGDLWKIGFNGTSWGTWGDMGGGGSLVSNPFAVQYESEMDVFIRGKDGHIYKDTWNGSKWGGLSSLGGSLAGNPMAMVWNGWELDVYSPCSNGDVCKIGWNGNKWGTWGDMGGYSPADPFVLEYTNGSYSEMDIYALNTSHSISKIGFNSGSWGSWGNMGNGNIQNEPMVIDYHDGSYSEMDIYATGTNGHVWKIGWNGSKWGTWGDMGI